MTDHFTETTSQGFFSRMGAEIPFRNAQFVANDAADLIPFRQGRPRRR